MVYSFFFVSFARLFACHIRNMQSSMISKIWSMIKKRSEFVYCSFNILSHFFFHCMILKWITEMNNLFIVPKKLFKPTGDRIRWTANCCREGLQEVALMPFQTHEVEVVCFAASARNYSQVSSRVSWWFWGHQKRPIKIYTTQHNIYCKFHWVKGDELSLEKVSVLYSHGLTSRRSKIFYFVFPE